MKKHILQENYERFFGKREFGDPLPTFKGVMEKHQVNKLKEGWWDNMNAASQAAYIKKHPGSKQAQQADDDKGGGDNSERLGQISQEKSAAEKEMAHAEEVGDKNAYADAEQKLHDLEQEEEGLGGSGEPDKKDDLGKSYPDGNAPPNTSMVDSFSSQKHLDNSLEQQKEYERHLNRWAEEAADNDDDEALEKIQKLMDDNKKEQERLENDGASEADVAGDDDYDMGEVPGSRAPDQDIEPGDPEMRSGDESVEELGDMMKQQQNYIEDMFEKGADREDIEAAEGNLMDLEKEYDEKVESGEDVGTSYSDKGVNPVTGLPMKRTGNELNQETLMIDGKQYRRISEMTSKTKRDMENSFDSAEDLDDFITKHQSGIPKNQWRKMDNYLDDIRDEEEGMKPSGWADPAKKGLKKILTRYIKESAKPNNRISEGVKKQPKPKYAFSEFYQRFKRQE